MPIICEIITHERFWGSVYMPDVYVVFVLFLVILTVTLRVIFSLPMFLATIRIFSQGVIVSSPSQLEDLFMGYKLGSCSLFFNQWA